MWFGSYPDGGILFLFGEVVPLVARGGGQLLALVLGSNGNIRNASSAFWAISELRNVPGILGTFLVILGFSSGFLGNLGDLGGFTVL